MRLIVVLILFFSFSSIAQEDSSVLVIGNYTSLCAFDSTYQYVDTLPEEIDSYSIIWVFSGSTSNLNQADVHRLISFLKKGGGIYIGSENWPLQAESNQITQELYLKSSFGNYQARHAEVCPTGGNLRLASLDSIPAGNTTVAFPMDYRLKVEAWVGDQPLILSGKLGEGRVIIDGGYSRFYCEQQTDETDAVLQLFSEYLRN